MGNQNARTHGFYSSRVTENEQDSFLHAIRLNGLRGEIALLRLKIRRIVANPDAPPELLFQAINALVRTMELNERIKQNPSLDTRCQITPPTTGFLIRFPYF